MRALELAKIEKLNGLHFYYWKCCIMLALTLKRIGNVLKEPSPMLPENPIEEPLKDHQKLAISFNDNDLIVKIIMTTYIEVDLVKSFKDDQIAKEVFKVVSTKYDTKTTTHIQVLVQQYNSYKM